LFVEGSNDKIRLPCVNGAAAETIPALEVKIIFDKYISLP
jgi:hypothetical protein